MSVEFDEEKKYSETSGTQVTNQFDDEGDIFGGGLISQLMKKIGLKNKKQALVVSSLVILVCFALSAVLFYKTYTDSTIHSTILRQAI